MGVNQWNVDQPWDRADDNCFIAISAAFDAAADANSNFRGTVWGITFTNEYILEDWQGHRVLNIIVQNKARVRSLGLEICTRTHMCHKMLNNSNRLYNVLSKIASQSEFIMCNIYPDEGVVRGSIENAVESIGNSYKAYTAALRE